MEPRFLQGTTDSGDECTCEAPADSGIVIQRNKCDPTNTTRCEENCNGIHGKDTYLADKCCVHSGVSASLLAFEEDSKWVPRIEEYNKCTGANIRLEYLPEGEDGMADALIRDVGEADSSNGGEGIFDAYIVQGPWLPQVWEGLANLSPFIKENQDVIDFTDINSGSRSAVTYNSTVRALPLDTDYIAIGWRQDVFHKNGMALRPPRTIEELADFAEMLNGKDHNGDGKPDWGVCLTPQVNYFMAFVAPVLQTNLLVPGTNTKTGQNMFFNSSTFEPLIRNDGFKYALKQYWRIIRASNCQTELKNGQKCDRKTAFPTGGCPMVISMPGTLTNMLKEGGKYAPRDRINPDTGEVEWSITEQYIGTETGYWARRAAFPGSSLVQSFEEGKLVACPRSSYGDSKYCPLARDGINFAPFFAEGGEAYALNGVQSKPSATSAMWDMFTWLAELPVPVLPLSGQYRKSHLSEEHGDELIASGWDPQMVDDLFTEVLDNYFLDEREGGNPVQDLLMLGFSDYMDALDDELHNKLLGVYVDSPEGGLFDKQDPSNSVDPQKDPKTFDDAYDIFVNNLWDRYTEVSVSMSGKTIGQLQRWRQSLNLPLRTNEELCMTLLESGDAAAFDYLECRDNGALSINDLCQTNKEAVQAYDASLCVDQSSGIGGGALAAAIIVPMLFMLAIIIFVWKQKNKNNGDSIWAVKVTELEFDDPPVIIGRGTFGLVVLAEYRGTQVAVKRVIPPRVYYDQQKKAAGSSGGSESSINRSGILGKGDLTEDKDRLTQSGASIASAFEFPEAKNGGQETSNTTGTSSNDTNGDYSESNQEQYKASGSSVVTFDFASASGGGANPYTSSGASRQMYTASGGSTASGPIVPTQSRKRSTVGSALASMRQRDEYSRLKEEFIIEMRYLSKLRHPCITTVMGAVIEKNQEPMLIMEYMERGSLYDMLHNETVPLDGDLLLPLLRDIAQGIRFLHAADPLVVHGDLKAANVLVDAKFRAKVADFGLSCKKGIGATGTPLWMAPELLRGESENTAASDVYSFGMILYEVYSRKDPYADEEDLGQVLRDVANPEVSKRPPVPEACPKMVADIMVECLADDPHARPTFEELDLRLKRLTVGNVEPGEMHLSHQTRKMLKSQRAESLLYDVFPKHIADALRDGRKVDQESHESVTIFFSDIVGFTTISQSISPRKVADMLDRLYEKFDALSHKHDIFKIETIGDAYMAITNLVKDQKSDHVKRVAEFSIDAIQAARETIIDREDPDRGYVEIRVGFHTGSVISDVVGTRLPKFSVFGDTVNTASRMESNSIRGCIQCSKDSAVILKKQAPGLPIVSRGTIRVKGKGDMHTYWVNADSIDAESGAPVRLHSQGRRRSSTRKEQVKPNVVQEEPKPSAAAAEPVLNASVPYATNDTVENGSSNDSVSASDYDA